MTSYRKYGNDPVHQSALARPIACYNVGPHRYLSLADNSDNFDL